ncbi:MAG: hypothetical protein H7Z71_09235 [Moraxellaceae bacterium]|nr:hypothetical protein [Pseudobdellovibrionaceae bacterium]
MRKEFLALFVGTIFLMAVLYWNDHNKSVDKIKPVAASARIQPESVSSNPQNNFPNQITSADSSTTASVVPVTEVENHKQFAAHLKTLSQCLQIKNNVDYDQVDPTFDNLIVSLKPAMGDVTVFTDDWAQTDLQYSDGTLKRLRVEVGYDDPGNPSKYLQVYKLNEQNIPEIENLDPQQTTNPSDEYVESMKTGANILLHEKGGRAYFPGGEEMIVIERNGKLESFTMTKNNKTISCNTMTSAASNCQCF